MSTITTATGLVIEEVTVGTGAEAERGQHVSVHYTGWLMDGTKFDSSKDRNDPFAFSLGAGQVIAGWDEGVTGMKVGGTRKLTIPPQLGYGARRRRRHPAGCHAGVRGGTARRLITAGNSEKRGAHGAPFSFSAVMPLSGHGRDRSGPSTTVCPTRP